VLPLLVVPLLVVLPLLLEATPLLLVVPPLEVVPLLEVPLPPSAPFSVELLPQCAERIVTLATAAVSTGSR
jgi:hypothetical protein